MARSFRLTGVHVLTAILAFFAVIIFVNAIFLTLALRSYPGEHEAKSYMQGLNYNERLAARERQAALGWTMEIAEARLERRVESQAGGGPVGQDPALPGPGGGKGTRRIRGGTRKGERE